jgi:hypothetical protein
MTIQSAERMLGASSDSMPMCRRCEASERRLTGRAPAFWKAPTRTEKPAPICTPLRMGRVEWSERAAT